MKKKKLIFGIVIICFILVMILMAIKERKHFWKWDITRSNVFQESLDKIAMEEQQGFVCSLYSLENYREEIFLKHRGIQVEMVPSEFKNGEELSQFIKEAMKVHPDLEHVYIGLGRNFSENGIFQKIDQKILDMSNWEYEIAETIKGYPDTEFNFILEYPSKDAYLKGGEKKLTEFINWSREMVYLFSTIENRDNVKIYMPGAEIFVTGNKANFDEYGNPIEDLTRFVSIQVPCEDAYRVTTDNIEEKLSDLQEVIYQEEIPFVADTEYTYVMFGDSVIGNYTDSMSIPQVIYGHTGVKVYNCGYGGLSAAGDNHLGIADVVEFFLNGSYEKIIEEGKPVKESIKVFHENIDQINQEKLVFILSLGLNDYMSEKNLEGTGKESFTGAMKIAIRELKESYPMCEIVLLSPNFLALFQNGTQVLNGSTLEDYVNKIEEISKEEQVRYIDIYHESGIDASNEAYYLADKCHPNEYGRYRIGTLLAERFSEWYGIPR